MSLEIDRYVHTPVYVNAVQVTGENMLRVAKWCGGQILNNPATNQPYILIDVVRASKPRQSQAYSGDWVVESAAGWKMYFDKAFQRDYMKALDQGVTIIIEEDKNAEQAEDEPSENDVPVGITS